MGKYIYLVNLVSTPMNEMGAKLGNFFELIISFQVLAFKVIIKKVKFKFIFKYLIIHLRKYLL